MSFRLELFAVNGTSARAIGDRWVSCADTSTLATIRAWLGAMRINIASLLAEGDAYAALVVTSDAGSPTGAFFIDRAWPHDIQTSERMADTAAAPTTKRRTKTKEKTR